MENGPAHAPIPILSLRGVTKAFGSVKANDGIDMDVFPGQVHAVLGENGAGKSTLMSILAGRYRPDGGEVTLRGEKTVFSSPARALSAGIGMVYQRHMLVESLTVAENIILGTPGSRLRLNLSRICEEVLAFSQRFGLAVDPHRKIWQLSMGERQRVEILKLLYRRAEILIFDEPTAVLSPPEIEAFFATLEELTRSGHTVLFITHKLEEVMRMADRITIMRKGRVMANLLPEQVRSRRELARLMVGREIVLKVDKPEFPPGETVFAADNLTAAPDSQGVTAFTDIRLAVRKGEILAVTGVAGNGQGPLVAALCGLAPFQSGTIRFGGRRHDDVSWTGADKRNMVYIPEDRHRTASVGDLDIAGNFMLTRLREFRRGPFLRSEAAGRAAERAIARYGIVAPAGRRSVAGQLSGGNLQKLILARELDRRPALIVAEHPTHGLDVGATEDIWTALLKQREHAGILLVSGDLKEVLSLADRVAVMFRGRILKTISTGNPDEVSRIGLLMAGATEEKTDVRL